MIVVAFIAGCIAEGSEVFIANEGSSSTCPPAVGARLRLVWRQTLFFAHNLIVYAVMLFVFPQDLKWTALAAIPAFALLALNGAWVSLGVGDHHHAVPRHPADHAERRAADVLPDPDRLDLRRPGQLRQPRHRVAGPAGGVQTRSCTSARSSRRPLLGQDQLLRHWVVSSPSRWSAGPSRCWSCVRYRSRVAYWV
jgi:ABC-2 type transport system permease protein